jgi:hypothetical protein
MKRLIPVMVVMAGLLGPGLAAPAQAGLEVGAVAHQRSDDIAGMGFWQPWAQEADARAQLIISLIYNERQGVAGKLGATASTFRKRAFRKKATPADARSPINIALMYETGQGVAQDYAQAIKWYLKAADGGEPRAFRILGAFYARGDAVKRDVVQSYMWFNISALRGDMVAQKFRDIIAIGMTPTEIIRAEKLARAWLRSHPEI